MHRTSLKVFVVAVALAAAGWGDLPRRKSTPPRRRSTRQQAAQATEYAPDAYAAARDAQAKLDAELTARERAGMVRSYGEATKLAAAVVETGDGAASEAVGGKQTAQTAASGRHGRMRKRQSPTPRPRSTRLRRARAARPIWRR